MKVFIIGGTGLLGSASAAEFIKRGHQVVSVALPPLPDKSCLPDEMEIIQGNYMEMSDDRIRGYLTGCDAFVFAAGVDERVEFPAPVLDYYIRYNVETVRRLLRLSKEAGVRRAVIMGSYFTYFNRIWPELKLSEYHPYIKARVSQQETALSFNGDGMDVMVLELPYIFGAQPGRKPVWTFLVESILKMKGATLYTKGGTTMLTVRQVAQAVVGAIERGKGGTSYPLGWYNMSWKVMLGIFHKYMGMPGRKIITIPSFMYRLNGKKIMRDFKRRGIESGLDIVAYTAIQTAETFIDKTLIQNELGVTDDDIEAAIGDSVKLCLEVIEGKKEMIDMRAE